ncbi:RNA polymerase sigma factor [Pedobacter nutrimenti]|uniref:RNA polymerase sigma factor (Sigma-70 family) n=1 Tax=Pedobacter nutrimenti TaxID=1241337 RepID=A0A318UDE8_9SPHI|nr:sigma-70 family RNA polymerase sigma factor [Pedobacter nutrimenti]PYF72526.1 RNA polymerase sigma factor (sigma-70 family) [Pedobacter nutrimenti]
MPAEKSQNIIQTVTKYGKRLFSFIRSRVNTEEDAEDILQEVWYQLSNQPEANAIEQISGWLHRVARNKITDKYRKQHHEFLEDFAYEDNEGEINFREILMTDSSTPEAEELKKLFWEQLFTALDELPENQRNVFIQNELEEKTFQDLAKATGENIKTLISRKGYAVKHLRYRLFNLYQEFINY